MKIYNTEVLIIGAGPAGLAAAINLRQRGVRQVMVVDREPEAGGIPRHCHHIGFGMQDMYRLLTGPAYAARYVRLAQEQGVDIQTGTTITGWKNPTCLAATRPDGLAEIKASAVIVATGCRERPRSARLIPGSRPAGVYTTGALQNAVYMHRHPVGSRALVIGADHVGFSAVMTLKHAGADVVAIVTDLPQHQSFLAFKLVSADRYRVPLWTNQKVTEIFGKQRVEAVELTDVTSGAIRQVECDTVVFTGGWIPDHELAYQGGLAIDPQSRSPRVDLQLRTSVEGVFAAGNLVHAAETASMAALSGVHVARAVHNYLETGNWPAARMIPITSAPPIQWVSPHMIGTDQRQAPQNQFTLRVQTVLRYPTLTIWQGEQRLWQQSFRRLVPNLPVHVSDRWLGAIQDDMQPIRFELS